MGEVCGPLLACVKQDPELLSWLIPLLKSFAKRGEPPSMFELFNYAGPVEKAARKNPDLLSAARPVMDALSADGKGGKMIDMVESFLGLPRSPPRKAKKVKARVDL